MPSKLKKTPYISPLTNAFTLIELLLGVALTLIVVSVAGFGLVNILRNEYKTNAESEIRNNLNRATGFISDETRRAQEIVENQSDIVRPEGNRIPSDAQMTLALKLPNYRDQIIYYTTSASNPWIGPRVLHRWGPPLDRNGDYELVYSSGRVTNANWVNSALVDMISDYRQVPDTDCDGWTRVPSEIDLVNGFFVCVNGGDRKLVRLRLNSEIPLTSTTTTRDGRSTEQDKAVYSADTKIFARSSVASANPGPSFISISERTNPPLCSPGSCRISGGRGDFVAIPTISYPVRSGDTLIITAGNVNTLYGNSDLSEQKVEIFTNQDRNGQGVILYPTLTNNQVMYVLTDVPERKTYNFVVTFNN